MGVSRAAQPAPEAEVREVLDAGIEELSLGIEAPARRKMLEFIALMERWNRVYNLTRIVGAREMVTLHLLDSLTAVRFLRGELILDLGTGAGVPGIPLALAAPERMFVLLDANAKKTRFCEHVVSVLGLGNVRVVHARVEAYRVPEPFHTIVSRAVAPLARLVDWTAHLAGPETRRVLLKGKCPSEELEELGPMGENAGMIRVRVPGSSIMRHIVLLDGIGFTTWPE